MRIVNQDPGEGGGNLETWKPEVSRGGNLGPECPADSSMGMSSSTDAAQRPGLAFCSRIRVTYNHSIVAHKLEYNRFAGFSYA